MTKRSNGLVSRALVAAVLLLPMAVAGGCLRQSGGTWYFKNAPLPEGWPALTPVGEVQVKSYPSYRAASVSRSDAGGGMSSMFGELFGHISRNDIAMTAPVGMEYESDSGHQMAAMSFLYRTAEVREVGVDGSVVIEDVQPESAVSIGVRGDYTEPRFRAGLDRLRTWLDEHPEWTPSGTPRYFGYNGPFVPGFWKYGEVQIPVRRLESAQR